jgi:hypothetical protein
MQFNAYVSGENYQFYFINSTTVLVSGTKAEYILYKTRSWKCADEIPMDLLYDFSETIEHHQAAPVKQGI